MNYNVIKDSFFKLKQYCETEDYTGWDPYDGLNSRFFNVLPAYISEKKWPRIFMTQLLKHSPINFRKFLLVPKQQNPKALALFLTGYCNIYHLNKNQDVMNKIQSLADKLLEIRTPGFSGACWGYNFPWQSRAFYQERYSPTVVASCFAGYALLDAYDITKNEKYLKTAVSIKDFIIMDLNIKHVDKESLIFSYSPFDNTEVINASLLGAKLLARIYFYNKDASLISLAKKAVKYACDLQAGDGSWPYGGLSYQSWIDSFHTGYNIEAIYDYQKYSQDFSFEENINLGKAFYINNFILPNGIPKYYSDKVYPIDIHCPSQYISTLVETNMSHYSLEKTLSWTINNMQDKKGFFYFQKKKLWTIKLPYMRWSQAWMFYALSKYLKHNKNDDRDDYNK